MGKVRDTSEDAHAVQLQILPRSHVARIVEALDRSGIPYMVTGSLASWFHGQHRATGGLDIVIEPTPDALRRFVGEPGGDLSSWA